MPRPSVIPQVGERLEAYLNDRDTEYQAQSADQKAATLPSTPDGKKRCAQWEAVVVVVEKSSLVTREWLYTAITRGRELVLLIGTVDALEQAVRRRSVRITGFAVPAR